MSAGKSAGEGRERRVQRRIHVGLPILVRGSDAGGRYEDAVQSFDVSRTGLSFATARAIALGDDVEIVIPPSGSLRNTEKEFCTLAHVVRVQNGESASERIVGVQFFGPRLNRVFVSEEA
jgi:hypothetical protein